MARINRVQRQQGGGLSQLSGILNVANAGKSLMSDGGTAKAGAKLGAGAALGVAKEGMSPVNKARVGGVTDTGMGIARAMSGDASGAIQAVSGLQQLGQAGQQVAEQTAMDRRLETQQRSDMPIPQKLAMLRQAEMELPNLPKDISMEMGQPIFTAMANLANQVRQMSPQEQNQIGQEYKQILQQMG